MIQNSRPIVRTTKNSQTTKPFHAMLIQLEHEQQNIVSVLYIFTNLNQKYSTFLANTQQRCYMKRRRRIRPFD